jgi:uncharacterized protein YeaO (DUF488 family)
MSRRERKNDVVGVGRVYDPPGPDDGLRVLVDRIWPSGLSKARAQLDDWCRDVAPSTALRRWYGHSPDRFAEFRRRYRDELASGSQAEALHRLAALAESQTLTLLTATKDLSTSQAAVLAELLAEQPTSP